MRPRAIVPTNKLLNWRHGHPCRLIKAKAELSNRAQYFGVLHVVLFFVPPLFHVLGHHVVFPIPVLQDVLDSSRYADLGPSEPHAAAREDQALGDLEPFVVQLDHVSVLAQVGGVQVGEGTAQAPHPHPCVQFPRLLVHRFGDLELIPSAFERFFQGWDDFFPVRIQEHHVHVVVVQDEVAFTVHSQQGSEVRPIIDVGFVQHRHHGQEDVPQQLPTQHEPPVVDCTQGKVGGSTGKDRGQRLPPASVPSLHVVFHVPCLFFSPSDVLLGLLRRFFRPVRRAHRSGMRPTRLSCRRPRPLRSLGGFGGGLDQGGARG
eukprot:scaffold752_cov322-Pavlova_lutheri.AAC.19